MHCLVAPGALPTRSLPGICVGLGIASLLVAFSWVERGRSVGSPPTPAPPVRISELVFDIHGNLQSIRQAPTHFVYDRGSRVQAIVPRRPRPAHDHPVVTPGQEVAPRSPIDELGRVTEYRYTPDDDGVVPPSRKAR